MRKHPNCVIMRSTITIMISVNSVQNLANTESRKIRECDLMHNRAIYTYMHARKDVGTLSGYTKWIVKAHIYNTSAKTSFNFLNLPIVHSHHSGQFL